MEPMEIIGNPETGGHSGKTQVESVSGHPRNTGPMRASPRCGAKTRSGGSCRSPAVSGKKRCRMHGGAPGSGAPKHNGNAAWAVYATSD
jgi:hypothetical protein